MPYYEFECPKGHVVEASVPIGTATWPCDACHAEAVANHRRGEPVPEVTLAKRILSATRTTFVFADTGKRIKHVMKAAEKVREIKHS